MAYIYGHIHCGPMLLWLAEAAGVAPGKVAMAAQALADVVRQGYGTSNPKAGIAIREVIPWAAVERRLMEAGLIEDGARS